MKKRGVPLLRPETAGSLLRARVVRADERNGDLRPAVARRMSRRARSQEGAIRTAGRITRFILPGLIFSGVGLPGVALPAEYILQPSVRLESGYDDNYRLAEEDEDDVYINRVVAELALQRLTETLELQGLARIDYSAYSGEDEDLDNEDNELLNFSLSNQLTERSEFGFDALYKRDTLLRTANVFDDPSDVSFEPDNDVDANLVRQDVRRDRVTLNPSFSYALTELSGLRLSYLWLDVTHDDTEMAQVQDYEQQEAAVQLFNQLTPTDRLATTLTNTRYESEDENEYDSVSLEFGLDHAFSEILSGGFTIGVRQTEFETPSDDGDDTGFLAGLQFTRLGEVSSFNAAVRRRLAPSSSGDQVQSDQVVFNYTRELSPYTRFSMRAQYLNNQSLQDDGSDNEREYLIIEPILAWNFSPRWALGLSYRYRQEERDGSSVVSGLGGTSGQSIDGESNAVFLSLSWVRPFDLEE